MPAKSSAVGYALSAAANDKDGGIELAQLVLGRWDVDVNSDATVEGQRIAPLAFALAAAIDGREGGMGLARLLLDHRPVDVNSELAFSDDQRTTPLGYVLSVARDGDTPAKQEKAVGLVRLLLEREYVRVKTAFRCGNGKTTPVDFVLQGVFFSEGTKFHLMDVARWLMECRRIHVNTAIHILLVLDLAVRPGQNVGLKAEVKPKAVELVQRLLQRDDVDVNARLVVQGVPTLLLFAMIWAILRCPALDGLDAVNVLRPLLRREDLDVNALADFHLFNRVTPPDTKLNVLYALILSSRIGSRAAKGRGQTIAAVLSLLLGRKDLDINATNALEATEGGGTLRVPPLVLALTAIGQKDIPTGGWIRRWLRRPNADVNGGCTVGGTRGSPIGCAIAAVNDGIAGGPELLRLLLEREDIDLRTPTALGPECPSGPPLLLAAQAAQRRQRKAGPGADKHPFAEFLPLMVARGAPPLDDAALQAFVQSFSAVTEGPGDSTATRPTASNRFGNLLEPPNRFGNLLEPPV